MSVDQTGHENVLGALVDRIGCVFLFGLRSRQKLYDSPIVDRQAQIAPGTAARLDLDGPAGANQRIYAVAHVEKSFVREAWMGLEV